MPEHEDPVVVQATPPKQPSSNGKLSEDQKNALNIHNHAVIPAATSSGATSSPTTPPPTSGTWPPPTKASSTATGRSAPARVKTLPGGGKPNGSMAGAGRMWIRDKKDYHGEKIGVRVNFASYGHYTHVCVFLVVEQEWS
ncbi:MAG: hypothetical protein L6R35_001537 [Caloplaca aegaea]|nr:MAG: hypothetical protein L6R35_001537 [Caloplaca aegaea]